jgi:aminoglycoside phosphotransferase (APT) family kinase protein
VADWVARTLKARLLASKRLQGSTSATLYRLTMLGSRGITRCVLRLFTNAEWLAVEPDIPAHEAAALEKLRAAALPTPELLGVDPEGASCGLPALLMSELPGRVDLLPQDISSWLRQQAEFLARLHEIAPAEFPWRYRPYYKPQELAVPAWSTRPDLWEKAIAVVRSPAPVVPVCFIHRDYHMVNLLWRRGRLSGVVDWVNSCLGPAGVDVAWNRHNLAAAYGVPMADRFLEVCREVLGAPLDDQPYWDLQTLMEVLPGPIEVYPPWHEFGLTHLTNAIVTRRLEEYLESLL